MIFLGDYFDYGSELSEVLDILMELDRPAVFLLGNHEYEFLSFIDLYGDTEERKNKILDHFALKPNHLEWLYSKLSISYENNSAFFSHAGLDDRKTIEEQGLKELIYSCFRPNLSHVTSKLVVQGHLPIDRVKKYGNHLFVDTGCGLGGKLSAYIYPEEMVIQN